MQQRLISTTSKVACQGWRKVGRIQHPKWRSTKSSWCSYRRPIEVQRQSCHRCVKSGVCFHGTSKCSMGSAQQSAAISKVSPNPKRRKVDWGGTPESILAVQLSRWQSLWGHHCPLRPKVAALTSRRKSRRKRFRSHPAKAASSGETITTKVAKSQSAKRPTITQNTKFPKWSSGSSGRGTPAALKSAGVKSGLLDTETALGPKSSGPPVLGPQKPKSKSGLATCCNKSRKSLTSPSVRGGSCAKSCCSSAIVPKSHAMMQKSCQCNKSQTDHGAQDGRASDKVKVKTVAAERRKVKTQNPQQNPNTLNGKSSELTHMYIKSGAFAPEKLPSEKSSTITVSR